MQLTDLEESGSNGSFDEDKLVSSKNSGGFILPKVHVTKFEDNNKKLKLISPTKEIFTSRTLTETDTLQQFKNSMPMYLVGLPTEETVVEASSAYSKFRDF